MRPMRSALLVVLAMTVARSALRCGSTAPTHPPPSSADDDDDDDVQLGLAVPAHAAVEGRIVGGQPGRAGQFPFLVHIIIGGGMSQGLSPAAWLCCGALLTANVVVTAGHCAKLGSLFQLRLGIANLAATSMPPVLRLTSTKLIHERFGSDGAFANDIALLHFTEPIDFSDVVQPIRLPAGGGSHVGDTVLLAGWGHHANYDRLQSVLHFTESVVVSNRVCGLRHHDEGGDFIHGSNICVAGSAHKGPCGGDSGGPLVFYGRDGLPTIIGISSFNYKEDCESTVPRVYTRVSKYIRWIKSGIRSFGP